MGNEEKRGIREILQERHRLDRTLQEKFVRKRAIFFSDVCGYTQYVDKRGDIDGRAWLQKHHDMVLPLIRQNGGELIDMIGDGLMAAFESPLAAVKAGIAVQRALRTFNDKTKAANQMRVKIGIHSGELLVDVGHVAGDVVNVASRIQNQAAPEQILVSKAVFDEVCGSEDVLCRYHQAVQLKGKSEPVELYRVVWGDEDVLWPTARRVRAREGVAADPAAGVPRALHLEVAREGERLKISAHEQAGSESSTLRHYEELQVPMDWLETCSREVAELLNRANRTGRLTRDLLGKLRETGQLFSDELFTLNVKEMIRSSTAEHLTLHLDDRLVHVPWELLHDGERFLCQKFSMGRLVKTRQPLAGTGVRSLARPLKMLIVADPKGDLAGAYAEGTLLRDFLEAQAALFNVTLRSDPVTSAFIREKLRNYDIVHFAGHGEYDPRNPGAVGWCLNGGSLNPHDIMKMAGTASMPALVVSNACQSARTEEWRIRDHFEQEIYGLANAFLLAGVRHYVGTFWEILDEPSGRFALAFYRSLVSGQSVGVAVREARRSLIREYGEETIVWAGYVLYGDPTFGYMDRLRASPGREVSLRPGPVAGAGGPTREEVIDFGGKPARRRLRFLPFVAGLAALLGVLFWGHGQLQKRSAERERVAALTAYREGRYDDALAASLALLQTGVHRAQANLVRGDVLFRRGQWSAAQEAYEAALEAAGGNPAGQAAALMGLGRLASLRQDPEAALEHYRRASDLAPGESRAVLAQAMVLQRQGNHPAALNLLERAREMDPGDLSLQAMTNETRERVHWLQDAERQARVDEMIAALMKKARNGLPAGPADTWTSRPLTLWVTDLAVQGVVPEEGEERLLAAGTAGFLLKRGRIRIVERALLDRLLEELKLGSSPLADQSTALSLGRLLAARLILTGRIVYAGPQAEVVLRLIESETGEVRATFREAFGADIPASAMAERLGALLSAKIEALFPLRGKILAAEGEETRINIGGRAGVKAGDVFRTAEGDTRIRIVKVEAENSSGRLTAGTTAPQVGQQVIEVRSD